MFGRFVAAPAAMPWSNAATPIAAFIVLFIFLIILILPILNRRKSKRYLAEPASIIQAPTQMDEQDTRQFNPLADNLDAVFADCRATGSFRDLQFENCVFERCDFGRASLENLAFVDCRFLDSDLTMTDLPDSTFNGAVFERCRLRGIDWTRISAALLTVEFHECVLDYANFEGMKLKKTPFLKCSLMEASFERADLRESVFTGSRFTKTSFHGADLRQADFRDTEDLALDLSACQCRGLKLRLADARGTLQMQGVKVSP